jgi:hypothetical protein
LAVEFHVVLGGDYLHQGPAWKHHMLNYKTHIASAITALMLLASEADAAQQSCGSGQVRYDLSWTANIENERSLSGLPSMAFAQSAAGPDLPVALRFAGLTERYEFDRPRVTGRDLGYLEIEQGLFHHDEFTRAELYFDRDVHQLSFMIEDLDAGFQADRSFSDRVKLEAQSRYSPGINVVPRFYTQPVAPYAARDARELHQDVPGEIRPVYAKTFSDNKFDVIRAAYSTPVDRLRIEFGSAAASQGSHAFVGHPSPQRLIISNLSFCVNLDNS